MVDQVGLPLGTAWPLVATATEVVSEQVMVGLPAGELAGELAEAWLLEVGAAWVVVAGAVLGVALAEGLAERCSVAVTGHQVVVSTMVTVGAGVAQLDDGVTVWVVGLGQGLMVLVLVGVLTEQGEVEVGAAVDVCSSVAVTGQIVVVAVTTEVTTFWVWRAGQLGMEAAQLVMV